MHRLRFTAFLVQITISGSRQIRARLLGAVEHRLRRAFVHHVVAVEEPKVFPLRFLNAAVARRRHAPVFLRNHPNARIVPRIFFQNLPRTVRRAVVHKDNLDLAHRLIQN